jgi:dihydropteroate synthase
LRRADGLPVVMGVVNVTPDSFSDGGQWFEPSAAIEHGHELIAQGADILDVGGESTRPGAERPSVAEEKRRVLPVVAAGIAADRIVLDPGFGFAKLTGHNWSLLRGLDRLLDLGHPILVGTSRKTFLGRLGVPEGGEPRAPLDRDPATAATSMHAARLGAWGVRVHHIPSTLDAMRVARAIQDAQ